MIVRSGYVSLDTGSLWNLGDSGYSWSSVTITYSSAFSANAYGFYFIPPHISPSNNYGDRHYGFPVRCLVILVSKLPKILPD